MPKVTITGFDKIPDQRNSDKRKTPTRIPRPSRSPITNHGSSTAASSFVNIQPGAAIAVKTKIPQIRKSPKPETSVHMKLALGK